MSEREEGVSLKSPSLAFNPGPLHQSVWKHEQGLGLMKNLLNLKFSLGDGLLHHMQLWLGLTPGSGHRDTPGKAHGTIRDARDHNLVNCMQASHLATVLCLQP